MTCNNKCPFFTRYLSKFDNDWQKGIWKGKEMNSKQKLNASKLWQRLSDIGEAKLNGQVGIHFLDRVSKNIAYWKNTTHESYVKENNSTDYGYFTEDDIKQFTPHSIRRTGATILAGSGLSLELLMIAGNWKSANVARGYIANSILTKRTVAQAMSTAMKDDDVDDTNLFQVSNEVSADDSDVELETDAENSNAKRVCKRDSSDEQPVVVSIVYNITCGNISNGSVVSNMK